MQKYKDHKLEFEAGFHFLLKTCLKKHYRKYGGVQNEVECSMFDVRCCFDWNNTLQQCPHHTELETRTEIYATLLVRFCHLVALLV